MSEIRTLGLYLAKNIFQVHGADGFGAVVLRRQQQTPGARQFLRWLLHTHPKIIIEGARFFEKEEAFFWEHDADARRQLLDQK